jgi:hypothetical protein
MARDKLTDDDSALLEELGVEVEAKNKGIHTSREERIISGFEEIENFINVNGRLPQHGEVNDIFERIYAIRLEKIRSSTECTELLEKIDKKGLLKNQSESNYSSDLNLDDDALLAELGVKGSYKTDLTTLKYVKPTAEKKAAEEIGQRSVCEDFMKFKNLFIQIQADLKSGVRKTFRFKEDASINKSEYFILGGQIAYIAEIGELTQTASSNWDGRLRIIFDNGTESNILMRSLQKALYKDEGGRRISDPDAGPLFGSFLAEEDTESGTIYVLRSKSELPEIKSNANLLHKIGVTGNDVEKRIGNPRIDPTFLMADVEIVATYELYNINRKKLENLLHAFFDNARLNISIMDRFGNPIFPREWFLVPLFIIDEVVNKIKDGTVSEYLFDEKNMRLVKTQPRKL